MANRKRIRGPLRAFDGSAFLKCDECGCSVAVALLDMHECGRKKDFKRLKGKSEQLVVEKVKEVCVSDEPRSAFHFFLESYTKTCVGRNLIEVDREAFEKWKKMTTEEQTPYVLQAEKVEVAYMKVISAEVNQLSQEGDDEADSATIPKFVQDYHEYYDDSGNSDNYDIDWSEI